MEILKGIPVSPGVSIGEAFLQESEEVRISQLYVLDELIESEIARFKHAVLVVSDEIDVIRKQTEEQLGANLGAILTVQTQLLKDATLHKQIIDRIRNDKFAVEHAVSTTLKNFAKRLAGLSGQIFAHRDSDIYDIQKRLLKALMGEHGEDLKHLERPVVLIAHDLGPSQTASLDRSKIKAFAIDVGGRTSHTAILARAFELPAVVGLETVSTDVSGGEMVIIDGNRGIVVLRPDERTLARYRRLQQEFQSFEQLLIREKDLPAVTLDGREIHVYANIELPEEVENAMSHGATGIGLFRTEFLYLTSGILPDEIAHFEAYRKSLSKLGDRPLIIRTMDLGADKIMPDHITHERNPVLGLRSIRVSMKYPDSFRTQVRAILRASGLGKVRLMLPMITTLEELRWAKQNIEETKQELLREGHTIDKQIAVGIMVEVPAAALLADLFAKEADFFSIGTNDLIQYTLAVDRGNELVASLYSPTNPAVLALLRNTINAASQANIPCSMCGEMAGDPIYTALLIGMGLTELSISPPSIPEIKKIIRNIRYDDCKKLAATVKETIEISAVYELLRSYLNEHLSDGEKFGAK
ncbi:MAG: phosphoenolpyruvate--protein phosphotransferase [Planctomycetota bacterium]